jgi:hypothetical protein
MGYPWPSFGTFQFKRTETAHFETDAGWVLAPTYAQQRPIGSTVDNIIAISIGSASRTFECNLEQSRLNELQSRLNTQATFTDWVRPLPNSRPAFLTEVTPLERFIHVSKSTDPAINGTFQIEYRVRVTLISQDASLVTP